MKCGMEILGATFEVLEWVSNFTPHLSLHYLFVLGFELSHVSKGGSDVRTLNNQLAVNRYNADMAIEQGRFKI